MLSRFKPKEYWEKRARKYGSQACGYLDKEYYEYHERLRERAVFKTIQINLGMRILDIGCGVGNWGFRFAKRGASVIGIDFSRELICIAKKRVERNRSHVEFCVMSAENLAFRPNSFDLCTSITVLQHITNPNQLTSAVKDIARVVKPGGHILLLEWCPVKGVMTDSLYITYRTRYEWVKTFEEEGMILTMEEGVGFLASRLLSLFNASIRMLYNAYAHVRSKKSGDTYAQPKGELVKVPQKRVSLYAVSRKIILSLSKIVDYHLSGSHHVRRFCDYRVLLFKKK